MTIPQATSFFSATADFASGLDTPREFLERCLARLEAFESVGAFVCHDIAAAGTAAETTGPSPSSCAAISLPCETDRIPHWPDRRQGANLEPTHPSGAGP